ncbi:hypothetical protein BP5796_01158 [Coleophoma crateriformis]|uniref:AAA+ ATPase domain-containing protein n=1 Tax=Coleophoma crateriformis TaxID=565419 RepID=A0A3D8SZP3_9HELO|nr:hypothetical protein BP5796_01158 [Coleophoma crateriformis]
MNGTKSGGGSGDNGDALTVGILDELQNLKDEVESQRNRIHALEGRLSMSDPLRRTYSTAEPTAPTEGGSDDTETAQEYIFLTARNTIPSVRECNFAQFKNRFEPGGTDGRYAVDVLVSGALLHQEINEEHKLRTLLSEQRGSGPIPRIGKDKALAKAVKLANTTIDVISHAQLKEKWPRRLRVQSPALLRILARVNGESWSDRPRTYYRPFNSLIYQHPEMREVLEVLEQRWGAQLDGNSSADAGAANERTTNGAGDSREDDEDEADDCPGALACLRAYVKYVDENIMTDYHRFEEEDGSSNTRVRFSDLWYLFRTGEFVYRPVDGELPDRRDFRTGKRIWKTYYVDPVPERMVATAADDAENQDTALRHEDTAFSLGCYYVDHTGEEFCVVKQKFTIEQFAGEMSVGALPIYPMRFCQDWSSNLTHAVQTGESLIELMKAKHCFYSGWTLTRSAGGDSTTDAQGAQLEQPEHINSEVMVDFGEAYQACPHWRPHRARMRQKIVEGLTIQEDFRIRWWSGADRASLLGETTELIAVRSGVASKQRNKYVAKDPFLVAVSENTRRLQPTMEKDLTDDAKALLTGRVFAYVFQERKFAQLSVAKLRQSPKTDLALDSLKIPNAIKHAIQGSVRGHFLQKKVERRIDPNWASLDLIQGKGTGLFILLHGVPGVGKTATAEAIAQANGKPLFKMTVGDLGVTPDRLELSLREIFRLASIWDCILLLDEVDTFFSQRSRADTATHKNAMVSVFLRVLDYYSGILFLTTNRSGVLDEAFKSRIHYKIYYPDLTLEQTLDIWKLNIHRVRKIEEELAKVEQRESLLINDNDLLGFAQCLFLEGGSNRRGHGRWNGRQIRNAFQVACSLAYYEHRFNQEKAGLATARDAGSDRPVLSVRHFQTMHDITASFENYRAAIHGGTSDAELALEAEYRNDGYRDGLVEGLQAEYRDDHLRAAAATSGDKVANNELNDNNKADAAVVFPSAGSGRLQQPRQNIAMGGDGIPAAENLASNNLEHRGSYSSHRGGSFRSNATSGQGQQQTMFPTPSPRRNSIRDPGSNGLHSSGNYIAIGASMPNYSHSPRNSTGNIQGPFTYQSPSQYRNEAGSMGEGRDHAAKDYFGSGSSPFSPTGREGSGSIGASGAPGSRVWGAATGGQGYVNQYAGYGRDPQSRPGPNVETDLSPDEVPY